MDEDKKEKKKIRSYGKWMPSKRKDNGEPLRKRGRKTGTKLITEVAIDVEIGTIFNYTTFGKVNIEHPDNIAQGAKPGEALTVIQACKEYGIHPNTFYQHINKYPHIKEKYELLKEDKRSYLRDVAEDNIGNVISGNTKLGDKEVLETSKWFLEKTSKTYNPKTEIETKSIGITLHKNSEDILTDLSKILGLSQVNTQSENDD